MKKLEKYKDFEKPENNLNTIMWLGFILLILLLLLFIGIRFVLWIQGAIK